MFNVQLFYYLCSRLLSCIKVRELSWIEQQPSKLWVLGSNPNRVTIIRTSSGVLFVLFLPHFSTFCLFLQPNQNKV